MPIKVLVVDDSSFFVSQIVAIINSHPQLSVVGTASNGRDAITQVEKLKPDVVTMDYEMPIMDGITAVKEIMRRSPVPILMFSSLTVTGARVTLDALDAGAVDFLPKFREEMRGSAEIKRTLCDKILAVARPKSTITHTRAPAKRPTKRPDLITIGTSTGGPVALQRVLSKIQANILAPILVIQHMPASFTGPFSERLDQLCTLKVMEAKSDTSLQPNTVYVAPGGKQMMVSGRNRIKIIEGDERLNYKPSVDITFGSAANVYGANVLAIVLTGMGSDGTEGARLLKGKGATVWIQDGASCVIDGMPSSVAKAGYSDEVIKLDDFSKRISQLF
ncbi:protein-glutamate methylesterase/protein-glutamine glutaminase [Salinibius halmophilus]|uniref:protein-glutamate methylesterase/protein-glutamine glutaminase n=1 Tax=Salinibius halmophilus TaxID=1853216 RepID=UPI000E6687A8|nr:chemotaxis response regulator protein-glutamate methylesterase [Salinibius halmophilus]